MIKINGVEFEYDLYDLEAAQKVKRELEKTAFAMEHPPKNLDRIKQFILSISKIKYVIANSATLIIFLQ